MEAVESFLQDCDGRAPEAWVPPGHSAGCGHGVQWTWRCWTRLAGLSTLVPVAQDTDRGAPNPAFSAVISAETGWKLGLLVFFCRAYAVRQLKLKVSPSTSAAEIERVRKLAGPGVELGVDANMSWSLEQAREQMPAFAATAWPGSSNHSPRAAWGSRPVGSRDRAKGGCRRKLGHSRIRCALSSNNAAAPG